MNERIGKDGDLSAFTLLNEDERLSTEDQETVRILREGLLHLECLEPSSAPPLHWFETHITNGKRKHRNRLIRELAVLWSLGIVLMSVLYQVLHNAPAAFFTLQAAAAAAPLFMLLRGGVKEGGMRDDVR